MRKIKSGGSRMGVLDEIPLDRNRTLVQMIITECLKCFNGEVNGISVYTSGAFICHSHGDNFASLRVFDLH